ncbi:hypothetical protein [Crenalkalicoccus roseus]|uniref:hypothetical protein n=1 Tax=Crenalkalicoccus roseus TaxID=1485588 RepID=UPI001081348E|nr:hypothetical protein [Crenalkalicoccus roseus]
MAWSLDARIPVTVITDPDDLPAALAGRPAALLAEAPGPPSPLAAAAAAFAPGESHPAGCACCAGRPPAAAALDALFQARVRGRCPWFERVVALVPSAAGRAALAAALRTDAVTAARFRPG